MTKILLVGDVHGKIEKYQELLAKHSEPVIQVGDMGCGFTNIPNFESQHKFIRGNHDSPKHAALHPNYLGEYGYIPEYNLFYMGGAFSIDYQWRQMEMARGGRDCWWPDEELSIVELNRAMNLYLETKPRIVVSHECPQEAGYTLLQIEQKRLYKASCCESRTAQVMQLMFEQHLPDLWVFGHYHFSRNFLIDKTRFLCLNELETFSCDTENPIDDALFMGLGTGDLW